MTDLLPGELESIEIDAEPIVGTPHQCLSNVVFLVPGLNVGGAELLTVELRKQLECRGFTTRLVVHGRKQSDVVMSHPGAANATFLNLKGMSDLAGWWKVRQLIHRDTDVIVASNQMPLIVAVVLRLVGGTRAKIACVFHTTLLGPSERRLFFLFRWALRFADAIVYVSNNQKAYWSERGLTCKRASVIVNGIDTRRFSVVAGEREAMRARLGFAEDDFVIGLVAAFRPEKNHQLLIEALDILRKRGASAKVLLVGNGPTREAVEALVATKGLSAQVLFAGEQSDVRPYIAACDVGVLCSFTETMPLAAIEFMALGVPMVLSWAGGGSEIVNDGHDGLLFDVDSLEEFVAQLTKLIPAEARAKVSAAALVRSASFSLNKMVDQYVLLLSDLAGETC